MSNSNFNNSSFSSNMGLFNSIKADYEIDKETIHEFKDIRKLYDIMPKTEYHMDDQTFSDLNLGEVYKKLDKSYSSPGEAALYSMLRNLLTDESKLKERTSLLDFFSNNESRKLQIHNLFFNLGYDNKNAFMEMLESYIKVNKLKYFIYSLLGKILPLIIILMFVLTKNPNFILVLAGVCTVNCIINYYEGKNIKDNGLYYLKNMLTVAKKINKLRTPKLDKYNSDLKDILKELRNIDRGISLLSLNNTLGGLFESISIPFLISESVYYRISGELLAKKNLLYKLYYTIGEIEALISMSTYRDNLKDNYCIPNFISNVKISIVDGFHPLINNPITNSINIDKHGIILTGTNMSGKSTFLRMISINIMLAQTFNFALANTYEGCFFNLVSSISPNDDVSLGKSYYMAEAEALLRIIKATEAPMPVFCVIDEIFRGTNPIERIASSAEILRYINSKEALCIVATHDRELTDILKDNYDFFYFSDSVDNTSGLSFDYKLKSGISQNRNAIKLLEYIGYPKEIIQKSYDRAKHIDGFI